MISDRAERIARLIDPDIEDADFDAALAACSVEEKADARSLLYLSAEFSLNCALNELRMAFLAGGEEWQP